MGSRHIFVDTSAFYAVADRKDKHHKAAKTGFEKIIKENCNLILTNFVVAETHALMLSRLGIEAGIEWLEKLPGNVERVKQEDEVGAKEIILKYRDKGFSYCDATSFAVIKRLNIEEAFSFDRHFRQYPGFTLLDIDKGGGNA